MSSDPNNEKKTAMIFAGEVFDGHDTEHKPLQDLAGKLHVVRVRAMPARHLSRVLQLVTDEAALLEFVVQRGITEGGQVTGWESVDAQWIDNLDEDSHARAYAAAKRQNFSRAASWGERQIAAKEFQAPLLLKADQALSPVVEKMSRLLISSLQQSGSLGAPATKS